MINFDWYHNWRQNQWQYVWYVRIHQWPFNGPSCFCSTGTTALGSEVTWTLRACAFPWDHALKSIEKQDPSISFNLPKTNNDSRPCFCLYISSRKHPKTYCVWITLGFTQCNSGNSSLWVLPNFKGEFNPQIRTERQRMIPKEPNACQLSQVVNKTLRRIAGLYKLNYINASETSHSNAVSALQHMLRCISVQTKPSSTEEGRGGPSLSSPLKTGEINPKFLAALKIFNKPRP